MSQNNILFGKVMKERKRKKEEKIYTDTHEIPCDAPMCDMKVGTLQMDLVAGLWGLTLQEYCPSACLSYGHPISLRLPKATSIEDVPHFATTVTWLLSLTPYLLPLITVTLVHFMEQWWV